MTTARQLRRTATGLAGTEEIDDGGRVAFAVDGRVFAVLDAGAAVLSLPGDDAGTVRVEHPTATVTDGGMTRLPLSDVNGQQLNHWVRRAWTHRAPAGLAARASAAADTRPGAVGDLPTTIGRPATRALAELGVTRLDRIAAMSDRELLAIHGVGPKAVRLLREAAGPPGPG